MDTIPQPGIGVSLWISDSTDVGLQRHNSARLFPSGGKEPANTVIGSFPHAFRIRLFRLCISTDHSFGEVIC